MNTWQLPGTAQAAEDFLRYYGYRPKVIREIEGDTAGIFFCVDETYLLKIYDSRMTEAKHCISGLFSRLSVLEFLNSQTPLKGNIHVPVRTTDGQLFYTHGTLTGVVFRYIPGHAVGFHQDYTTRDLNQLVPLIQALHHVDPAPFQDLCPREDFCPDFCEDLRRFLQTRIQELPWCFREILLESRSMLLFKSILCQETARHLKNLDLPFVFCHTAIHGGNLIRNPDGKLFLINWENLILAPKEADLSVFCEKSYFHLFGKSSDGLLLTYYRTRRDLEDIWKFFNSILNGKYAPGEYSVICGYLQRILEHLKS